LHQTLEATRIDNTSFFSKKGGPIYYFKITLP
jgi:hypothetical protein